MSQISPIKEPAFIVIDETGYDEDDNPDEEEESSYEFLYRSNIMKTKTKNTNIDQVPVNDVFDIDEPNTSKENSTNKDETKNGRITDLEVRNKKSNIKMNNEVIIDDDEDDIIVEEAVKTSSRKRRGTVDTNMFETVGPSTSKQMSKSEKLRKDVVEESDEAVEVQSIRKTERKHKIAGDPDESNRKVRVRERDDAPSTSAARIEKRNKRNDPVGVKKSPEMDVVLLIKNEIATDEDNDEEDIKVERNVERVKRRKSRLKDTVIKRDGASTSKQILKAGELSDDGSEESIDIVEYRPKRKTVKKSENKTSVIHLDEPDGRESRDNDHEMNKPKKMRKKIKPMEEEEEASDTDIAVLSENEITVITDDEDTEDIKLEPIIEEKHSLSEKKERTSPKKETIQAEHKNEGESSSAQEPRKKTRRIEARKEEDSNTEIALISETHEEDTEDIKLEPIIEVKRSLSEKKETTGAEHKEKGESSSAQEPRKKKQTEKNNVDENPKVEWSECDYLCEFNQITPRVAENLLTLFKNDNTIPFIARYRKEMTGGLEPEKLRSIRHSYDNMKLVKAKALLILQNIDKLGKWNPEIYSDVMSAKTMDDLNVIYAPFKPGAKTSLAERAKELGLAPVCDDIIQGRPITSLHSFIDPEKEGLRNLEEVRQGVIHILAYVITKDRTTAEAIVELRKRTEATIVTKPRNTSKAGMKDKRSEIDVQKYENYLNSKWSEKNIKDHQILAINRGEDQKVLSVSINMPDWFQKELKRRCLKKYQFVKEISQFRREILEQSFDNAYSRLIKQQISRQVRNQLSERAENASIKVFANNLKNLLLTPPIRGKTVLGIDPGFRQGCKLAVVSPCGDVLDTAKIYPNCNPESQVRKKEAAQILAGLVKKHNCTVIALGNATACRETEQFLSNLIKDRVFAPINLSYTIIDEAGASIYSCSKEAKSEFPNLDPNLISAVSLARRLEDPLAELIKVEPKHLGIGMYQHDLPQKQLQLTLNEVISEVVSFVGVDVNTASQCLLKKVAGLSETKAANIIKHRNNCGPFTNRQQLLDVAGVGPKSFEQCAGFIRISPETASIRGALSSTTKHRLDYLDQTWIHPESYDIARQFLKACKCSLAELGTARFIDTVSSYAKYRGLKILADEYGTSTMDIIINGLSMKKGQDIRINKDAPLFKKNLRCIDDLEVETRLTGSVRNVTHFGAFVDIGVGNNGLVHISEMRGRVLTVGQKVEVLVIDKARGRISLSLIVH